MFDRILIQKDYVRFFIFAFLLFSIVFLPKFAIFSQQSDFVEYKVVGRVIDENGKPKFDTSVIVFPKTKFCHTFERSWTDNDGKFEGIVRAKKGETYYLYVSSVLENAKGHKSLISTPFQCSNLNSDKFLGKPITFGDETVIDVGNINVQFWFGAVYPKLTIKGKKLTEKQWQQIWIRLLDEQGRVVAEESIAPTIKDDEVDLKKSLMKLSFPEGKWKLEFQKFDYDQVKIYPEIIGETPYFTIDKNKKPEVIEVKIKL